MPGNSMLRRVTERQKPRHPIRMNFSASFAGGERHQGTATPAVSHIRGNAPRPCDGRQRAGGRGGGAGMSAGHALRATEAETQSHGVPLGWAWAPGIHQRRQQPPAPRDKSPPPLPPSIRGPASPFSRGPCARGTQRTVVWHRGSGGAGDTEAGPSTAKGSRTGTARPGQCPCPPQIPFELRTSGAYGNAGLGGRGRAGAGRRTRQNATQSQCG